MSLIRALTNRFERTPGLFRTTVTAFYFRGFKDTLFRLSRPAYVWPFLTISFPTFWQLHQLSIFHRFPALSSARLAPSTGDAPSLSPGVVRRRRLRCLMVFSRPASALELARVVPSSTPVPPVFLPFTALSRDVIPRVSFSLRCSSPLATRGHSFRFFSPPQNAAFLRVRPHTPTTSAWDCHSLSPLGVRVTPSAFLPV